MRAYYKNDDNGGTIELTNVALVDGQHYSKIGVPINPTGKIETFMGWPDHIVDEYETDLGAKFYIPAKS